MMSNCFNSIHTNIFLKDITLVASLLYDHIFKSGFFPFSPSWWMIKTHMQKQIGRKERVRGMERVAWKHATVICKTASGHFLYYSGNSNWGSVTIQRDGKTWQVGGRLNREATYVNLRLIHIAVWPKSNQYYKTIIFQFKKKTQIKDDALFSILSTESYEGQYFL